MRTLKEIIPSTEAQLSKEMKWKVSSIITYFESEIRQAYAKNRNFAIYFLIQQVHSIERLLKKPKLRLKPQVIK